MNNKKIISATLLVSDGPVENEYFYELLQIQQKDLINLFEEKEQLPFYNQNINPPPKLVLDYRKRLEKCSVMMLIGSCHNLRLNSILENWVDWVLHPKWFFSYRSLMPGNKYFKN